MTTTEASRHADPSTTLDNAVERIVQDARDARAAAVVLAGASEMETRYCTEVSAMLATVELDLGIAKAALEARQARDTSDVHQPMADVVEATRAWAEELTVQGDLARMEARDRAADISRRLDHTVAEARRVAGRVSETLDDDLDEMRTLALYGISDVREALDDALTAIRQSW